MSPTNSQSNNETNRQASLVSSLPFDYTSSKKITMADPKLLLDHPANVGLFGLQRLIEIADLVVSIQRGFDQSHPIKVKKLENGALEMIDGHRRQRAALELDLPLVPIELASFDSDEEERREMIEANLVRNHKFRSVGQCTAVRLIEQLQPRDVKRGRPPKKNQVETTEITEVNGEPSEDSNADGDRERRKFYADLLGMKIHRFRIVDYINRHGTPEEQNEVDLKLRTPAAVYKVVHARVNNVSST
jgi:hypothetical protein